jgi:hypothetical protein
MKQQGNLSCFLILILETAIFDYGNEQIIDETTLWRIPLP